MSLFFANKGYHPDLQVWSTQELPSQTAETFAANLEKTHRELKWAIAEAQIYSTHIQNRGPSVHPSQVHLNYPTVQEACRMLPRPLQCVGESRDPLIPHKTTGVMLDSHLGNKSDIFHHNHENNQLKR